MKMMPLAAIRSLRVMVERDARAPLTRVVVATIDHATRRRSSAWCRGRVTYVRLPGSSYGGPGVGEQRTVVPIDQLVDGSSPGALRQLPRPYAEQPAADDRPRARRPPGAVRARRRVVEHPGLEVADHVGRAAGARRDHRHAAGGRLAEGVAAGLVVAGMHEHVERREHGGQVAGVEGAGELRAAAADPAARRAADRRRSRPGGCRADRPARARRRTSWRRRRLPTYPTTTRGAERDRAQRPARRAASRRAGRG